MLCGPQIWLSRTYNSCQDRLGSKENSTLRDSMEELVPARLAKKMGNRWADLDTSRSYADVMLLINCWSMGEKALKKVKTGPGARIRLWLPPSAAVFCHLFTRTETGCFTLAIIPNSSSFRNSGFVCAHKLMLAIQKTPSYVEPRSENIEIENPKSRF